MKPIIGIVGRADIEKNGKPTIGVLENYRQAIIKAGGVPILILPPQLLEYENTNPKDASLLTDKEIEILNIQLKLVQGIVIPGGSKMYEYDLYISKWTNDNKIPLFGICLGMQTMSKLDGFFPNIKINNHDEEDVSDVHEVTIDKNSKLYSIVKEEKIMVNSRHNYAIKKANGYEIVGYSPDGIIEAIEKKDDDFNIAVQWHPEKNYDEDIISQRLFTYFIEQARKKVC